MHTAGVDSKTCLCNAMQVAFFEEEKSLHFRATEFQLPMTEKENQQTKKAKYIVRVSYIVCYFSLNERREICDQQLCLKLTAVCNTSSKIKLALHG